LYPSALPPAGLRPRRILDSRLLQHVPSKPAVTKRIPQPRSELSPRVRVHEAKLLAVMLRTSRLTWVFGEPGTDKGALLKSGVMPLLQRRAGDRSAAPVAVSDRFSAPDRRRRPVDRLARRRVEVAIYFDTWGEASLSLLKNRIGETLPADANGAAIIRSSLTDTLQQLNQQLGLHFIFLLDRFEEYLAMAPDAGEVAQFANELVEAVLHQDLPASFLVSMDEVARLRLERFRARIPGFDHNVLRLSPVSELQDRTSELWPAVAPQGLVSKNQESAQALLRARTDLPAFERQRRGPPPRVPIKVEEVYAFIESKLARTTAQTRGEPVLGDVNVIAVVPPSGLVSPACGAPGDALQLPAEMQPGRSDAEVEDSFFSIAEESQRRSHTRKTVPVQALGSAFEWLKKRR
jgi:hypothetical protein